MSEVSCRACLPLLKALRASGHSPERVLEGLPFRVEDLERPSNRIAWDDFTAVLDRTDRALGDPGRLEEFAARYISGSTGIVGALVANFVSVRPVYQLGARLYGPSLFSCTRATCEELPGGRLRQTIEILPPFRDSEVFFRAMRGALRATPSIIGQPEAAVEMELQPRRAVYTITPPPGLTLWARARRLFSRRRMISEMLTELTVQHEELQESYQRARAAGEQLAAQSRQLETLNRLGRELARRTDVGELADSVMKLLEDHFRFEGVELWLMPSEGHAPQRLRQTGRRSGEPSLRHAFRTGDRIVGRLDLWEPQASDDASTRRLLQELLPWIALALDNARSFEALSRQTRRLEEEIAERRRAEQQLQQAQKMEAVGRLAGGLAHDFNNLLTAITGYAELARDALEPDDPARDDIEEISAVSERAAALIKQIMAFSRRQMLLPRRLDLNAVVLEMEKMLGRLVGEHIELAIVPAPDLATVMADPGQLEQVIVNLVVNSRDALPGGGRIEIETSNAAVGPAGGPAGSELGPGRSVRLQVRDNGCGMDSETRARIFEPFFSTKPREEGTGLGLATVYGIVTQSGGAIAVESKVGRGTAVTIHLPAVEGAPDAVETAEVDTLIPGGKETLLLVEDEEPVRTVARRTLESWGYSVLEAPDGEAALAVCRSHSGSIDALITDVVMPGIDGRELARRLPALRPELRGVIYVSGYASDDVEADGRPASERVFLRKPFSRRALLGAVRRLLDAP